MLSVLKDILCANEMLKGADESNFLSAFALRSLLMAESKAPLSRREASGTSSIINW